jgi:hypothetical protein
MNQFISDPSSLPLLVAVAFLFSLFVFSSLSLLRTPAALIRTADTTAATVLGNLRGQEQQLNSAGRALSRTLRTQVLGERNGRWVLGQPLGSVVEEWADRVRTRSAGFIVGGSFTGFALVITFGLIAYVLFTDVSRAIQLSDVATPLTSGGASPSTGAAELAAAVAKMGSKFFISSAGLLLALLNAFTVKWSEALWDKAGEAVCGHLAQHFVEIRGAQLDHMVESTAATRTVSADVQAMRSDLADRLDRLRNIEVSVKDLGTEVTANLNQLVQDALTSKIQLLLTDTRAIAEGIAEQLGQALRGNFRELSERLVSALQDVQTALEKQSGSEVEKLLGRLQDAVSGGFSSETKNMSNLLLEFQSVFPELARQLHSVSGQMAQVLDGLIAQQREQRALVDGMAAATSENVQRLSNDLAKGGAEAMARVLAETNARIDRMVGALDAASMKNAGRAESMSAEFEQIAERVNGVTHGLNGSLTNVQTLMKDVELTLAESASGVMQLTSAVSQLRAASDGVQRALGLSEQVRSAIEQSLKEQVELSAKNVKGLEHMQEVWPRLLEDVTKAIQATTGQFTSSWTTLAGKLEDATSIYGTQVGERVEDLSAAVDRLGQHLQANGTPQRR